MSGVTLCYIGPGKKGTGNWCFSDGYITFREILNLYMTNPHFKGKVLTIVSDCSYSGSWMREAMAFMDEQGVGPCGHMAKEKGILVKVFTCCLFTEIPIELAFSTHSIANDKNTGSISCNAGYLSGMISNGQHPSIVNFTEVHCKKKIDQPCTMAFGSTWKRWSIQNRIIRYTTRYADGSLAWKYVLLIDDNETICLVYDNDTDNASDYGMTLASGPGALSDQIPHWIKEQYCVDYDYGPSSHASN